MTEIDCDKTLPEKDWFKVTHGPELKCLRDLYDYLPRMSGPQYAHHAPGYKNDFAEWVKNVYDEKELADKLEKSHTKHDALVVLGSFMDECAENDEEDKDVSERKVRYDKVFLIKQGPAIGNLKSFKKFLPNMSEEQFSHHVNSRKNDFAQWAKDVYKDKKLTKAFESSKTKEDMIKNIEPFFVTDNTSKIVEQKSEDKPEQKNTDTKEEKLEEKDVPPENEKPKAEEKAPLEEPPEPDSGKNELLEKIKKEEVQAKAEQDELTKVEKIMDDKVFDDLKNKYEEKNEKMADRFDDIATRLKEAMEYKLSDESEEKIDKLKTRYEDLRQQISEHRKKGKDMFIASLTLRRFEGRLAVARVTQEKDDFKRAEIVLNEAEEEMKDGLNKNEVDVKKDVLMMAGQYVEKTEQ